MYESAKSIIPIALIVCIVSIIFTPLTVGTFVLFVIGIVTLIVGMGLFNLGAEMSMTTIGSRIGSKLTESKKIWLIALVSLVLGIVVTLAEPDLSILAEQVSSVENFVLMIAVAVGVGIFLTIAMLRILFKIPLNILLIISYSAVLVLCFFVPGDFLPLSFDSGGVTTGPMTVPFIMSLGVGVASVRAGKNAHDDSFGLVALSSIGPILAVEILGILYGGFGGSYELTAVTEVINTQGAFLSYAVGLGKYALEVLIAIAPIIAFFILFQIVTRSFAKRQIIRIFFGFIYTFIGLTLFITGANVGFMPVGRELGMALATFAGGALLIPVAMVLGYFVVIAEPAVHILNKHVMNMSAGAISEKAMRRSLSIGVSISLGLAMMRVLTNIPIIWIILPGYAIALLLTFFTPRMYTGIAFDSGGVASGAMVSAFILPLAIGACSALGGDVYMQAFGCVAFVALTPLITIQILGITYKIKVKKAQLELLTADDNITEYEVDYATETI